MAKRKSNTPHVRIVGVKNRTLQLRYKDPDTGKEVRISTGTHDRKQAEKLRRELLRDLRRGDRPAPTKPIKQGSLSWDEFRHQYRTLKKFRSEQGRESAEVRLDICEKIVRPRRLRDMADTQTLMRLQARLATTRSEYTVQSYMTALRAALNWAHGMGWLPEKVRFEMIGTSDVAVHKGRPITEAEFRRMLDAADVVCAARDPRSWQFLLRGLWLSGLRLAEALGMTWDEPGTIRPLRHKSGCVVLEIPAGKQKNRKDQTIPTTPEFAALLDEVPAGERTGLVFSVRKLHLQGPYHNPKQAGRVITALGREAGVLVSETKPASAHDLRRSFGQRLADAGVQAPDLQVIMRHKNFATTQKYYLRHTASDQAHRIANALGYADATRTQKNSIETTTDKPRNSL
ncbi:MAG: tyrosine-type recombinase/integrase [Planctomycetota bacterium]